MGMRSYRLSVLIAGALTIGLIHIQAGLAQNDGKDLPFPHGGPMGEQCDVCHSLEPTPEEMPKEKFSGFHPAPFRACFGCHGESPHIGAKRHLTLPTREAKAGIEQAIKKRANAFPLDASGKITCGTCHDPHSPAWGITGPARTVETNIPAAPNMALMQGLTEERREITAEKLGLPKDDKTIAFKLRSTETPLLWESASNGKLCAACHTDKAAMLPSGP